MAPSQLHAALESGKDAEALRLIEDGADLEQMDKNGMRPLHLAVHGDCVTAVEALLAKGVDVEAKFGDGDHASILGDHASILHAAACGYIRLCTRPVSPAQSLKVTLG